MSNKKDNLNTNYIYPQPYIDPMVYLNPYYSNAIGYQYNSQEYQGLNPNNNDPYIDYTKFNIKNDNGDNIQEDKEYTNIPEDDFNIPAIPNYIPSNVPNMILPNLNYNPLPPNMNQNPQPNPNYQLPYNPNMQFQYYPMFPVGMYPNMYPNPMMPNMMFNGYPFPNMPNINIEEFDEEEM